MSSEEGRGAAELGRDTSRRGVVSVQGVDVLASAQHVAEQLQSSLETQALIDLAIGVTMGQCDCAEAEALERLLDRSQADHQELAAIARGVVAGAVGLASTHGH